MPDKLDYIFRAPPCAVCGGKAGGFAVAVTNDNPEGELLPDFPPLVCRTCRDKAPPGAVTITGRDDRKSG